MKLNNQVQLITYPDSLGGNLAELIRLLDGPFRGLFPGGAHLLPPYPSSGDRGFAPLTYLEIDPRFGSWEDIRRIAEKHGVMLDVMVNHISRRSEYFLDFEKKGRRSPYADMFLTLDKIWEDGVPVEEDIRRMFLRRAVPYSTFRIEETGEEEKVWTTFGKTDPSEQIDLDIRSGQTRRYLEGIFRHFRDHGVRMVRLDAVGYVIKKRGTSCFFVEPEIGEFLDWVAELADRLDIALLPEVHAHISIQRRLAERGFWIYDFVLPYLVLEALLCHSGKDLRAYLESRPSNQFTMLDCHDGIPVKPDLDGLVDPDRARKVVEHCLERGANLSYVLSDRHKSPDGFDVHQIRCTYYDALGRNDEAYLAARAIQLFVPGIPQVYYVGLLAGRNDAKRAERTGDGRELNRHNYSLEEIEEAMSMDVVRRLMRLIRFRNEYEAFQGDFRVIDSPEQELVLEWRKGSSRCVLAVDLKAWRYHVEYVDEQGVSRLLAD
jgi:sucrose phosphorylase